MGSDPFSLKLQKMDLTTGKSEAQGIASLEGVTFKLVGLEEGDEYTATTDADGKLCWEGLIAQNYIIKVFYVSVHILEVLR